MEEHLDPRRQWLLALLETALAAVDGRARMRESLLHRDDLGGAWIIAVGKAAGAMTEGALDALGDGLARALVVSREGHFPPSLLADGRITCMVGGHPLPDARSLAAGEAALQMARQAGLGRPLLLLVSGGASSLLESLPAGVTLGDLQRVGRWAQDSGQPIEAVNAVRRRLSAVKDGRLLVQLAACRVEGYFLSDVPGDDPAVVGSGLLARATIDALPAGLPDWLATLLDQAAPGHVSACGGDSGSRVGEAPPLHCIASLDDALDAIERQARRLGLAVRRPDSRLEGDATAAAGRTVAALAAGPAGLLLLGGETTVTLPPEPGAGGRNQHLALAAALGIEGRDDLLLLAVGTDGSDGNTADAGALVDGGTLQRGRDAGLDPLHCLETADSGRFLEASGDLVHTGPTGTNVCDLVLGLRFSAGTAANTAS